MLTMYFKQANRLRKKLIKFQNTEDEISAQCSITKSRSDILIGRKSFDQIYVFSLNTFQQETATFTTVYQLIEAGAQFHNVITAWALKLVI